MTELETYARKILADHGCDIYTYGGEWSKYILDDLKKKYLTQEGDKWRVCDDVKKRVNFKQADLLREPYPKDYHLIVCRNVLIYFTEEAKDEIFRKYYDSLAPGGVLFIGSTEQIINYKEIGFIRKSSFYYEKPM